MASEVGVLVLETLHLWVNIEKKKVEKAIRYARIHIDAKGNKNHQVLVDEKWTEVEAKDYQSKAEGIRNGLIVKLKKELSGEVKEKVSKTPESKKEKKAEIKEEVTKKGGEVK
jgi:hypothetical protein